MNHTKLIEKLKKNERYEDFTFLDDGPVVFSKYFKDRNIPIVQVHNTTEIGDGIFSGQFKWEQGKIVSLDGDSYDDPVVVGYNWFEHKGQNCLDILVTSW